MADADTVLWYERNASALCCQYESARSDEIHSVLSRWIQSGMHVLELGCGSGRDARFMASLGADVVATDASAQMLGEARARAGRVTFRQLAMPPAEKDLREAGIVSGADSRPPFDAVVSIAMIMHLTDAELFATAKAIDRLVTDEGLVILSFCPSHPQNDARRYESRTAQSVRLLMEDFGFSCAEHRQTGDGLGRDIAWHTMVFVRNAAPRTARKHLQSVIFADEKTATYKLALLRSLCEISQGSAAHLRFEGESRVSIPLGLVIEKWIEYYWPLLDLPQLGGGRRMGFETELRALVQLFGRSGYAAFRNGLESGRLSSEALGAFERLVRAVRTTLIKGPIQYSGGSAGSRTFAYEKSLAPASRGAAALAKLTAGNGRLVFSGDLWSELRSSGLWLADSAVLQWANLIAEFKGLPKDQEYRGKLIAALTQATEERRDTTQARKAYGESSCLHCAWTGGSLRNGHFDVDHILPWSITHSNDLWNLVPAGKSVNRNKSDKLVDSDFFYSRRDAVAEDWHLLAAKEPEVFRAQAEHALIPEGLPADSWEEPLAERIGEALESLACRLQIERWQPGKASGAH
jgi:SAM-dependent methyltransferase